MSIVRHLFPVCALASLSVATSVVGCGSTLSSGGPNGIYDASQTFGQTTDDGGSDAAGNLPRCIVATNQCVSSGCTNTSGATTLSGTVYDPAEKNPLYGIVVYVPSTMPSAITTGASCYSCNSLYTGDPIAYAVTDSSGKFTLTGVPDGANVPLVVQVGKWRMQYTLPSVAKCADNDAEAILNTKLRLPRNHTEGDLPSMGIATGAADSLECLLSRIGVDASEYGGGPNSAGRIHIFSTPGGADTTPPAPRAPGGLWDSSADLTKYDITLLTCEGQETRQMNQQALYDYAQNGGRVFASHFHYAWFNTGPFAAHDLAAWTPGANEYTRDPNALILTTLPNGMPFPRGQAMKDWLTNVNALTQGELPLVQARHNAVVTTANAASLPWIETDTHAKPPTQTEYFSFDTPFGASPTEECGRVVFSDLHVGAASGDYNGYDSMGTLNGGAVVPDGCAQNALSPQEKALEFMLFDLSGCITPPDQGAGGVPTTIK